jgi:hypothetical protein
MLVTKAQYDKLPPWKKGYVYYMQEAIPGSELHGSSNPYPEGTKDHLKWDEGQMVAMLEAQDEDGD